MTESREKENLTTMLENQNGVFTFELSQTFLYFNSQYGKVNLKNETISFDTKIYIYIGISFLHWFPFLLKSKVYIVMANSVQKELICI